MKITGLKVMVCSPGRNFVTVKIETDKGVFGLGDATLNGREKAVAAYLESHLTSCLIGRDPFDTEDIWNYLYKGAYWRRGPVTMTAIGAVDIALWDIKSKALEVPLYQLLGGKSRNRLMAYTHAQGQDLAETVEDVVAVKEQGFRAIRVQSGIPGLKKVYGVSDKESYEPAVKSSRPVEENWSTAKYLEFIPKLFSAVRKEVGADIHLLHDAHHRLSPIEAARLGKELESYHLYWLEDATAAELQDRFRIIRQHTTTPLAVGEVFNSVYDCHQLMIEHLIDYIRMTVAHGGGITPMMKIANLASFHNIKTGCHGPSDLSPINMAACLHFGMAINNYGIQEYMGYPQETADVFSTSYKFADGYFTLDESPGLGVNYDEKKAKTFPYEKAYLPINRLEDGTLWDW
ncbi:MAG: D-galactonate dehydratase family protein [Saprospiraceae bacterium]|nr:D-galactonate dehydratase family protein [Saprospiraceae bacterium]